MALDPVLDTALGRMLFTALFLFVLLPVQSFSWASDFEPKGNFRVITYNVWGLPVPVKLNHKHLPRIAHAIPIYNADVILFQETFTKRAAILEKMPEYPYIAKGPSKKGKAIDAGLTVVSKHPIVRVLTKKYSRCTGTDCLANKGVMLATVKHPTIGEIDVYNTHLNAGFSAKAKWDQIAELVAFIRAQGPGRRVIIGGDFNLEPNSEYYSMLVGQLGFRDTQQTFAEENPHLPKEIRYPITHTLYMPLMRNAFPRKLDYILTTAENAKQDSVVYMDVVQSLTVLDGRHDDNRMSDHFALMVDFLL